MTAFRAAPKPRSVAADHAAPLTKSYSCVERVPSNVSALDFALPMIDLAEIYEKLQALEWTPLFLAVLLGGAIGYEREVHGRPAGLRTHILVCLAATVLIMAGNNLAEEASRLPDAGRLVFDPNRMGAGIMTGIGFLGAAAVIRTGDLVRGITTGACVWCVAGIGVVLGQREYGLAIGTTAMFLVVLVVFDYLVPFSPVIYRRLIVTGQASNMANLASDVGKILKNHKIRVQDLHGSTKSGDDHFELVFNIRLRQRHQAPEMLELLSGQAGITTVEWSALAH